MGSINGSPRNGFIKFTSCDNCTMPNCVGWSQCMDRRDNPDLEILPHPHETKFRWNTGK